MTKYILFGLSWGFYASITPGPLQAFFLSQTLKNGWRRTLPGAFAPLLSDGPIVALILLVLTQTPDIFLNILRIVGGFFIIYLAKGAFSTFKANTSSLDSPAESPQQSFFKAALMNVFNPNPYIFWSIIAGPLLLEGWRQSPSLGLSFVFAFYGAMITTFAGLIILFATAQHLGNKVTQTLSGVSAIVLLLFGLYQIWEGVSKLIS